MLTLTNQDEASPEDIAFFQLLNDYNTAHAGPSGNRQINLFLRDEAGQIRGGLKGRSAYRWMFVDWLAIDEEHRRQGLGSRLLHAAEDEARARECVGIYLDTYSFQALPFYQKHGYEVFGVLEDRPPGHSHYFLKKRLDGVVAGE